MYIYFERKTDMKKIVKILVLALSIMMLLVMFTGCEDSIVGLTKNINEFRCELFGHSIVITGTITPNCTNDGSTGEAVCEICGYVEATNTKIDAHGHRWEKATCTSPKKCKRCGVTEGDVVHALKDVEGKAASCTEDGYTAYKACENCDYTEGKTVIEAAHAWGEPDENGAVECTVCHTPQQ